MRTTLTLDPDVRQLLEAEVQRTHRPFKHVVNEALRRGLRQWSKPPAEVRLYVHDSALCAGYDARSFNSLADELEDDEQMAKAVR